MPALLGEPTNIIRQDFRYCPQNSSRPVAIVEKTEVDKIKVLLSQRLGEDALFQVRISIF